MSPETRVKPERGTIWALCGIWTLSCVKWGVFSDLGAGSDMIRTATEAWRTDQRAEKLETWRIIGKALQIDLIEPHLVKAKDVKKCTSFTHTHFPVGFKLSACELELNTKLLVWVKRNPRQPDIYSFLLHPRNIRLESGMENPFSQWQSIKYKYSPLLCIMSRMASPEPLAWSMFWNPEVPWKQWGI